MTFTIEPTDIAYVMAHGLLIADHKDEVSTVERKLSVDRAAYLTLEEAGKLLTLGAYAEGGLVGYSVNIVGRNIHYDMVTAYNSALFVHPNFRATPLGLRLMAATKAAAQQRGASLMLWHAKPDSQLNTLLQRKRLKVQDIVYQEQL
jgi:predicted GNAT superfamily acetyltransferase